MDRISTSTKATDLFGVGKHGWKDGNIGLGIAPTDLNADWFNGVQEELLGLIEGSGQVPAVAIRNQVTKALKRIAGANFKTVAAGASVLTVDDAGMVLVDATGGNVTLTLPAANAVPGLAIEFTFYRTDATANSVTVNRAGADTVDGVTSFALSNQYASRSIKGNASTSWATTGRAGDTSTGEAGNIAVFARSTPPTNWLKANGAAVSRTTYAALFAAIGTTFGAGNGSTTFNLPDLRGEFIRGWDDGRGVDSGRVFGSAQGDEIKAHSHNPPAGVDGWVGSQFSGDGSIDGSRVTGPGERNPINAATSNTGGTETRPRNVALLVCIKF